MVVLSSGLHASEFACYNMIACGRVEVPILACLKEMSLWIAHWESAGYAEPGPHGWEGVPNSTKPLSIA